MTILEEAKGVSPAKTYDAWATILSVDPSDKAAVLFSVGELIRLVETAQAAALDAGKDMDEAVVARPFRQLTKWLQGMNLEGNWDQFRRKMPADMLTGLRFCAEIVEREYGDGELGEDELEEFRMRAQELLQELEESDLPDDLKSVLRDSLLSFVRAVEQFKLRGLEGLSESVNNGIGSVIRHQEQVKKAADTALIGKYLIFLVAVEKSIALAEKARPMLGPVVRALLPGIEPVD